jgi:thioredoxin 1
MIHRRRTAARTLTLLTLALATLAVAIVATGCGGGDQPAGGTTVGATPSTADPGAGADVTFVELGSNSCVPCKAMRPIMAEVARKYRGSVDVIFYDVWKDPSRAQDFAVRLIPTQVFLDKDGKEFYRHEGFLALMAIDALLAKRGIDPIADAQ